MTTEEVIATGEDMMAYADKLRQEGDYPLAVQWYNAAHRSLWDNPSARIAALQQKGVTNRLLGNLDGAQSDLEDALEIALELAGELPPGVLIATIHRDLGAVHASLYLVYNEAADGHRVSIGRDHRNQARMHYSMSVALLSELPQTPKVEAEYSVSVAYRSHFEWQVADELPREDRIKAKQEQAAKLEAAYRELVTLGDAEAQRGNDSFEVYRINTLIRVVRTQPFTRRWSNRKELLHLTAQNSASPGRRKHALAALVGGDRVYSWLELREARRSR